MAPDKARTMNGPTPAAARSYLVVMMILGSTALAISGYQATLGSIGYHWLILASLTIVTGSFALKIPGVNSKVSVADTLVCANLLLFGPAAATFTAALDGLTGSLRCRTKSRRLEFVLFNVSAMALAAFAGGQLFSGVIGGMSFPRGVIAPAGTLLSALAAFTLAYFFANSIFVAIMIALEQGDSLVKVWREKLLWSVVNYVAAASAAGLIARTEGSITMLTILTTLTVIAAIYISSRSHVEVSQEALRQERQSSRLLNSVALLAEAIGRKERWMRQDALRLRGLVRGLGRAMGLSEPEAANVLVPAAMLHDVGKVAVPDAILGKPGDLTPDEFQALKIHPTVAADLLVSADYPQAVTDCVRFLRERWDGSGYPCGLKGDEIPLHARILAVADTYAVLTSDRPYRPRYGRDEALEILRANAGRRFDPLVVDTFVRTLPALEAELPRFDDIPTSAVPAETVPTAGATAP